MSISKTRYAFAAVFFSLFLMCSSAVAQTIGDFDGDGRSDISVALTDRVAGTTAWLSRNVSGALTSYTINSPADALVSGRFYSDPKYYPGAVLVASANLPLLWTIRNPQNSENRLFYGLPGDGVPNQGDLDCDGITDLIVTRANAPTLIPGFKYWYVALSGSGGQVVQQLFGLADDFAMVADMNGDGCSEMVVLRGSSYVWFSKGLTDPTVSAVQWGLPGDLPIPPSDINGDGSADYIVSRPTGALQTGFVRYSSSEAQTFSLGFADSIPMVGNFIRDNFFAWSQRDTGFMAYGNPAAPGNVGEVFPFGVASNVIIRPDGTVVQPNSTARFPAPAATPSQPDPPTSGENGGCGTGNGRFDNGELWKPVSESTGKPVALVNRVFSGGSVDIYGKNGDRVAGVQRATCCPNGGRAHFFMDKTVSQLRPSAPLTVRIARGGNVLCRTVPDPGTRYE